MATVTYVDQVTVIPTAWLQDLNDFFYTTFSGAAGGGISSASITITGLTLTGNLSVQGNTTIGNAVGDTLTVNPNAVTWSGNPTHSGNHTFSGNLVVTAAANNSLKLRNTAAGAANKAQFSVGNDTDADLLYIQSFASNFTANTLDIADGVTINGEGVGGLSLAATGGTLRFYAGGTTEHARFNSNGSLQLGGSAARATTAGTKRIDIFDGTAPVGTLANGISLYSTAGELRVMDAAGNATLLSPHDHVTNEWIFDSVESTTGRHLRIDVERLLKAVNEYMGLDCVHEYA